MAPDFLWLRLPPVAYRYRLNLLDGNGRYVPRTEAGRKLDITPLPESYNKDHFKNYSGIVLSKGVPAILPDRLPLRMYFDLSNSGRYRLILEIGVIWLKNTGSKPKESDYRVIFLPSVAADIDVRLDNGRGK